MKNNGISLPFENTLPSYPPSGKWAKNLFDNCVAKRPLSSAESIQGQYYPIALPKTRLNQSLMPGDVLVVRAYGTGKAYKAVLISGELMTRAEALERGLNINSSRNGFFVEASTTHTVDGASGRTFAARIADESGYLLYDSLLLRSDADRSFHARFEEATPPAAVPPPGVAAPARPVSSVYLPPAPNLYQPSANRAIFTCVPTPVQIPQATLFPTRPTDTDQTIEQVLAFMGLSQQDIRRFRDRRGFNTLRPIVQHFGDAFSELLIRLRYPVGWLKAPRESHDIRGVNQEEKLGPRLLLTIPGHFRELARRTNNPVEAFGLENTGWLMMESLRNQIDLDTGHRWWLPPVPDFVTKFPGNLPAFSTQLNDLIIDLGLTDSNVSLVQYNAKQSGWEAGLPGQFWRAETGQNLNLTPGLPFYPELVTIPAGVNVAREIAQIDAAWQTHRQAVETAHPINDRMTPEERLTVMNRITGILTDRNTDNPASIRNLFGRASYGGVALAYNFPQIEGDTIVRTYGRVLTRLVPAVEAVFQVVRELGWNDLLFHTAGSQLFRGTVNGGTPTAKYRSARNISKHAYGMALDLNEVENPLSGHASMNPRIVALFESFGFTWGDCFSSNKDPHHFEYNGNPYVRMASANARAIGRVISAASGQLPGATGSAMKAATQAVSQATSHIIKSITGEEASPAFSPDTNYTKTFAPTDYFSESQTPTFSSGGYRYGEFIFNNQTYKIRSDNKVFLNDTEVGSLAIQGNYSAMNFTYTLPAGTAQQTIDLMTTLPQTGSFLQIRGSHNLLIMANGKWILGKLDKKSKGYAASYGSVSDLVNTLLRLRDAGTLGLTDEQIRIICGVSLVESSGRVNTINTYDSDYLSMGFVQFTLKGKLQTLIQSAPVAFARYGIELEWDDTKKWAGGIRAIKGIENADDIRKNPLWIARFYEAGLDDDIIVAQAKQFINNDIHELLNTEFPKWGIDKNDAFFKDVITLMVIAEIKNNRPNYTGTVVRLARDEKTKNSRMTLTEFHEVLKLKTGDVYDWCNTTRKGGAPSNVLCPLTTGQVNDGYGKTGRQKGEGITTKIKGDWPAVESAWKAYELAKQKTSLAKPAATENMAYTNHIPANFQEDFKLPPEAILSDQIDFWQTKEITAFMKKVYDAQLKRSARLIGRKNENTQEIRTFYSGLPDEQLATVESGEVMATDAAAACRALLEKARADLAAAKAQANALAVKTSAIGVASGYRSLRRDFDAWQGAFKTNFEKGRNSEKGMTIGNDEDHKYWLSENLNQDDVQLMVNVLKGTKAIPGFSNHTRGNAVDFSTETRFKTKGKVYSLGPKKSQRSLWRNTWFYEWLGINAAGFGFKQLPSEEWHWDYVVKKAESPAESHLEQIWETETPAPIPRP